MLRIFLVNSGKTLGEFFLSYIIQLSGENFHIFMQKNDKIFRNFFVRGDFCYYFTKSAQSVSHRMEKIKKSFRDKCGDCVYTEGRILGGGMQTSVCGPDPVDGRR